MKNPRATALLTILLIAVIASGADADAVSGASDLRHFTTAPITNNTIPPVPVTQTIIVSDTDFLVPLGSVFAQYLADATLTGGASVEFSGFLDPTNASLSPSSDIPSTAMLIGTANDSTVPFIGPLVPLTLSGPYSLFLLVELTLPVGSSVTLDHSLSVVPASEVPAPASGILLLASVLVLVGVVRWRHRI